MEVLNRQKGLCMSVLLGLGGEGQHGVQGKRLQHMESAGERWQVGVWCWACTEGRVLDPFRESGRVNH